MSDPVPPTQFDPTEDLAGGERDPFDRMAEEFAERCRRGEAPSIAEYEARHPGDAEKVRRLLSAVAMMEQLRRGPDRPGPRPLPGRIGEYRVLRELGRGGMGVVYEAVQESLWRHVAVKAIHHVHLDAKRLQRFGREAQAVARLHHTNIVPIFGVGEHEGLPYYVMQYIRGRGLDALLAAWRDGGAPAGPDRWRFAARVGVQAAEALHHAHEQGVLHRDVKPANILLDEQGAAWVTDFGLAKLTDREDLTASGDVIGTLRYIAPESLRGRTDRRGDVYSLGLTLYELLTLNAPFGELDASELLRRVGEGGPTPPRRLEPEIPRDLETIVLKSIARDPDQRYATAGELADDLGRYLEDRPIRARRASLFERGWRWSRRNRALATLAATAAGSLLLAAVVGWIGYASTARALAREQDRRDEAEKANARAEANVALSLAVFGDLFEKLAPATSSLPPPPLGRRRRPPLAGDPAGGPGRGPGRGRPPGPDDGWPPPGLDGGPPPGPPILRDEPPGGPFAGNPEEKALLLRSVLTFYDRFAQQNAGNPSLRREAAWAYRKAGFLARSLGRDDEAEQDYSRAIAILEGLIEESPGERDLRFKLAWTCLLADPWSAAPAALGVVERRLRRGRDLAEGLVAESPDDLAYLQARVQALAKLGVASQRLGRPDEAEGFYRDGIGHAGALVGRANEPFWARLDRMAIREALALHLIARGRPDEARGLLDAVVDDARAVEGRRGMSHPVSDRLRSVAATYDSLGDAARAVEVARRAAELGGRPHDGPVPEAPGGRGRPGGPE